MQLTWLQAVLYFGCVCVCIVDICICICICIWITSRSSWLAGNMSSISCGWDCWPGKCTFRWNASFPLHIFPGSSHFIMWPPYNQIVHGSKHHWNIIVWEVWLDCHVYICVFVKKHCTGGSWGQLVCLPPTSSICHNKQWALRWGQFLKKPNLGKTSELKHLKVLFAGKG